MLRSETQKNTYIFILKISKYVLKYENSILVTFYGNRKEESIEINSSAQVAALKLSQSHMFLYGNGGKIMTHELQKDINHSMANGEFTLDSIDLVTSDDLNIYTVEGDR